ncbi:MAG: Ig-like domain-containing protein, partial [Thermoplasmata archaeon]|nr:Ig-like domain-containing protein [Thermoplasmata archaeon]
SVNETRVLVGDGSYLVSYGLIQVQVRNYTHDSVADATVEIRELTFLLQNSTTNGTGLTPELLVQKRRVSTAGLFDYTLNVEVWSPGLTFDDNPRLVNMDDEVLVLFTDLGDIIKPEIADSEIENGQQDVDVNASITITFSEPMNRTSVEEAFSISGNMTGTLHWEGSNLTFVPDHPYDYLTSYTVIVSTDAKDIQGNNLKEQLTFRFTTEPERSIMSGSGIAIGIVVILAIIGIATFLILKRK